MSKQPLKDLVSISVKEKDITSYQLLLIKQDRVLCKLKYLLLGLVNLNFFFFTFRKNWVDRAMGNVTFYWDGLVKKKKKNSSWLRL